MAALRNAAAWAGGGPATRGRVRMRTVRAVRLSWRNAPMSPVASDGRRSSAVSLPGGSGHYGLDNAVAAIVALRRGVPCFAYAAGGLERHDRAQPRTRGIDTSPVKADCRARRRRGCRVCGD